MATLDLDWLNAMSGEDIAARMAAPVKERAAFIGQAAQLGLAEAQAVYAQMLLDGTGVARDEQAAFHWFNRAAQQDHLMALNMVGRCYDLGWGVAVDKGRAASCFCVAAERGLGWAMYNHATALTLGDGVAQDRAQALDWFRRAVASGDPAVAAKAHNYIGSFHEDGWIVAQDLTAAASHYRHAAEGGDFRGKFNLARLLGADGAIEEALHWLAHVRDSATPAFLAKAERWLASAPVPALRDRGVRALRSGTVMP